MIKIWNLLWIVPLAASLGCLTMAVIAGGSQFDGTPKNCRECKYRNDCKSWYGGTACRHKDEICN